ncbi:PilN domain-containing protein [Candidatus Palauibacter sp.]|uniref:PilN domain-containing protein n=1 Tax=Candidatus Palauibacter sp. TaxID=3101350 RepID=UPI003B5AF44A
MIEVNLLPGSERSGTRGGSSEDPSRRRRARFDLLGTALLVATLTIPPGAAFLWWIQRSAAQTLRGRLDDAAADSARLAGLRIISDSLTARSTQIRERAALVEQLDRGRFLWPHVLDEISRALPRLAWLISLRRLSPPPDLALELHGVAANPLAITEFVRNLGASDYIGEVRILGSQKQGFESDEVSRQAFTLILRLSGTPTAPRADMTGTGSP